VLDNLAVRWTREETKILEDNLSEDIETLLELLPGRTKAGISAKKKRLLSANPIPTKFRAGILRFYLAGEPEGQILARMKEAGHSYTLRDIGAALKSARAEVETAYKEFYTSKLESLSTSMSDSALRLKLKERLKSRPSVQQLKEFLEENRGSQMD
jgi:hypothetical protein